MEEIFQIALDGPSGAGKSTIAKAVAEKLNIEYIDTGAMYRAVALKAIRENLDTNVLRESGSKKVTEEKNTLDAISKIMRHIDIDFRNRAVYLDGEDVSNLIRSPEISMGASNISQLSDVRSCLVERQRELGTKKSVIMDGRDIGTNVFPKAKFKFFLTASAEERAKRRYDELAKRENIKYEDVLEDILKRDKQDSQRALNPLRKADDAVLLDSTDMSIEDVVSKILAYVRENN